MNETPAERLTVREIKSGDRRSGERFASTLLVRKLTSRKARNGNPFLQVEFGDRTGAFSCFCFNDHPLFNAFADGAEGRAVHLSGEIDYYQNRLSPRLVDAVFLTEDELGEPEVLALLVESSPEDPDSMMVELYGFIERIGHPRLRATVENVFAEIGPAFKESPAALSMHHAYRCGLLEHTVHMARACEKLLPLYREVDPDLAMAGILLHDIGKTLEYVSHLAIRRSRAGILQGHVVLGYRIARKAGIRAKLEEPLLERLEHIILSHQGEMEWGAAAMAASPEAVFVSMIDNLDAKMGMVQQAIRQTAGETEFSEYLPGLKAPVLTSAPHPEDPEDEEAAAEDDVPAEELHLDLDESGRA